MSSEWIAAGAAVAAAVIGPLASLYIAKGQNRAAAVIARRQINASLISGNRQAWIDKLRDAIADFQSASYALGFRGGHSYERGEDDVKLDRAIHLRSRIALVINPTEPDHQQLLVLMDKALSIAYAAGADARKEMAVTQGAITETAQRLLKREWEVVKAGEPDEAGGRLAAPVSPNRIASPRRADDANSSATNEARSETEPRLASEIGCISVSAMSPADGTSLGTAVHRHPANCLIFNHRVPHRTPLSDHPA